MKKYYLHLLILIFLLIGSCYYWQQTNSVKPTLGEQLTELEKVDPKSITKWNQTMGDIKFSPDGQYLVVSSEGGKVRVIETKTNKVVYQQGLGIGFFKTIAFSADSKLLYIGESSPDGYLYCLSLPEGKRVWQYRTAGDLQNNLAKESYPGINNIVLDQKGHLYFTAGRSEKMGPSQREYIARIYALDAKTGKVLWKFPSKENLDTNSYWVDTDSQGKYVAFSTMNFNNAEKERYPGGSIYLLDGQEGKELWHHTVAPVVPFKKTAIWYNPAVSSDGKYLGVLTSDGRGYLLDNQGKILWEHSISTPKEVNGIPIYATGTHAYFVNNSLLFATTNSFDASKSKYDLPVEHPNANTVFAYDLQGNLLWKWQAKGYMERQNFTQDGKYMVCPVAKNFRTKDLAIHGVYLVDISQGQQGKVEVVKTYHPATKGPIISADISGDGKYIAGLESPVLLADGIERVGKYQLHLWSR